MLPCEAMEPQDATIEILRKIHAEIATSNTRLEKLEVATAEGFAGVRNELGELRHEVRRLDGKVSMTNETLGLIHSRLMFAEAASAAATAGRVRLDDRIDRLETRVDALEARDDPDDH